MPNNSKAPAHKSAIGKSTSKKKEMRLLKNNPMLGESKQVTQVNAPVATAAITRRALTKPVCIEMTEEISDVVVAPDFANTPLIINPGNHEMFPWLSQIAKAFTSYKFDRLGFRSVPATETGLGGDVVLAVNADPDKDAFTTEKQALNHEGSAMAAPWVPFGINGKQKTTQEVIPQKYVADTSSEAGLSTIFDDLHTVADGVLNVVTSGLNLFTVSSEVRERLRNLKKTISSTDKKTTDAIDKAMPGTDPPTTTGKLFVDYKVWLSDPVDTDEKEDDGFNFANPSAPNTQLYGCALLASADVIADDTSLWVQNSGFEQSTADPVHITVSNPSTGLSWMNFRDTGLYSIQEYWSVGSNHDFKEDSSYTPAIAVSTEGTATIVTSLGADGWSLQGSASGKGSSTPTGTFARYFRTTFVEITGEAVTDPGQVKITDSGGNNRAHMTNGCFLVITRVAHDLTPMRLALFAKKNLRMSLPDCPINAAIAHLRKERNHKKVVSVFDAMRRKVNKVMPSISAAARPPSDDELYFSVDEKGNEKATPKSTLLINTKK